MQQNALVYEIHEDRIQKLESAVNSTNACLAQQSTQLDYISNTVDSVKVDMHDNMSKGFDEVKQGIQKLHAVVQDHGKRIENIERSENERTNRWNSVYKILTFLAAGLAGAAIKNMVAEWFK